MSTHPRIAAQREILQQLLQKRPSEDDFDAQAIADWQRMGMGPLFYLYNGIRAYEQVIEQALQQLGEEERAWNNARQSSHRRDAVQE